MPYTAVSAGMVLTRVSLAVKQGMGSGGSIFCRLLVWLVVLPVWQPVKNKIIQTAKIFIKLFGGFILIPVAAQFAKCKRIFFQFQRFAAVFYDVHGSKHGFAEGHLRSFVF